VQDLYSDPAATMRDLLVGTLLNPPLLSCKAAIVVALLNCKYPMVW
jgi:hypothetical protein